MRPRETIVRVRGGGIAAVLDLIRTGQLKFDFVQTRHHGRNLWLAVIKRLATDPVLRDAFVFATDQHCRMRFRHGRTVEIDVDEDTVLIGIDCESEEIIRLVAGPEFERTEEP